MYPALAMPIDAGPDAIGQASVRADPRSRHGVNGADRERDLLVPTLSGSSSAARKLGFGLAVKFWRLGRPFAPTTT